MHTGYHGTNTIYTQEWRPLMRFREYYAKSNNVQHPGSRGGHPRWDGSEWRYDKLPPKTMQTYRTLEDVYRLAAAQHAEGQQVYVRYSRGPTADAKGGYRSTNHAAGRRESGLSVNNLLSDVLPNGKREIAERLHEYQYMVHQGGPGTRAWLLHGREVGRGADNEPLLADIQPLGWVGTEAATEAAVVWSERQALQEKKRTLERRYGPFSKEYNDFLQQEYYPDIAPHLVDS